MKKFIKLIKSPNLYFRDYFIKRAPLDSIAKSRPLIAKKITLNKIKSNIEYLNELTLLAACYDVNSLKYKNEFLWPYLRQHFTIQLFFKSAGKNADTLSPTRLQSGSHNNIKSYQRSLIKMKVNAYEIDELPQKKIDFLFLTVLNSSDHVELPNNNVYNRITDPWYEEAQKVGTAEKIEFIKTNTLAIEKCKRYLFKPTFILPPSIITSGYSYSINWDSDFFKVSSSVISSLNINEQLIKQTIDWELHCRKFYIDTLKKFNPKVLLVNGFHYHAPLISAAHELGITTVDIQHGLQVGWNPLYNNWNELPPCGYQSIPNIFLVWGNKEKKSIENVFNSNNHKAIIGGSPWLHYQLKYMEEINNKTLTKIKKYKKIFVVFMQQQSNVPSIYSEIIDEMDKDILWIVRNHPKGKKFKKIDFHSSAKNILINDYVDSLSLARILEVSNVCFSDGSTASIEADFYGVYSIIFTAEGKENYKDEINNNAFFFANTATECISILKNINYDVKESRLNYFYNKDPRDVLTEILRDKA